MPPLSPRCGIALIVVMIASIHKNFKKKYLLISHPSLAQENLASLSQPGKHQLSQSAERGR